jgi:hypothetical protein
LGGYECFDPSIWASIHLVFNSQHGKDPFYWQDQEYRMAGAWICPQFTISGVGVIPGSSAAFLFPLLADIEQKKSDKSHRVLCRVRGYA